MAKDKKSFIAYLDWKETFDLLSNEEAGVLIKHIFKYVNDENPSLSDRIIELSFSPIRQDLKRDLKKWETYIDKQKANGKKGGRPKTQKTQAFFEKPKKADNVNVNVLDSNINITTNIEEVESWIEELSSQNHKMWKEGVYMTHNLRDKVLSRISNEFKEHLKVYPTKHKNIEDFKKHLSSWIGLKIRNGEFKNYLKQSRGQL